MAFILAARLPGEPRRRDLNPYQPVCEGPLDYWRVMRGPWASNRVLVNIEHDMECSRELVAELLTCRHPLCTHAYRMYLPRTYWAHGRVTDYRLRETGEGIQWAAEGQEWADWSAIGFCKVGPEARVAPLARTEWSGVETAVNLAVGERWHIHWPGVEHYHKEPR